MRGSGGSVRLFVSLGLAFAFVLGFSFVASAQIQNATFTGTVTDPSGAVIPGATVTITNVGTNLTATVDTDSGGLYRAAELPVGSYKIEVSASGFKTAVKTGLFLSAGTIARVDFSLEVGAKTEVVTVEALATLVQTDDSRLYETVGSGRVASLPLNGRNVYALIQLAPGAVNVAGVSFENGQGTVVNGLRPNFNGFLINGVSNKGLSGGTVTLPNVDIVEEFQMLTLNMSAQYGNSAGSLTNLVTKSGTNDYHGSAYWYVRNDAFDANSFFRNKNADPNDPNDPLRKPPLVRFNQFGASATGRIIRDKLFFTGSFQGERFNTKSEAVPIVVESPQWRQAIISAFPNSVATLLYRNFPPSVPGTPTLNLTEFVTGFGSGSGFGSFANYLCPDNYPGGSPLPGQFATMLGVEAGDDFSTAAFDPIGDPAPCSVSPALQAGLVSRTVPFLHESLAVFGAQAAGNLFNGNEWSARIDYNLSKSDRLFGEFMWLKSTDSTGPGNNSSGPRGFLNPSSSYTPNFQFNYVRTFSPKVVNEFRAGFARRNDSIDVATPGVPSIGFDDGSAGFGSYNGYPQFFRENIYSYSDMVSVSKGKHNLKAGVDFRRNLENSEFNVARPSYYFFDQLFFAADSPYAEIAGVDPGFASGRSAELASNNRAWRNLEMGAFFQDDWKVARNLTLNLGLRYDLYTRHVEQFGRQTTFIPGPGGLTRANGAFLEWISNANIPAGSPGCDTPEQMAGAVLAGVCGPGGFAVTNALGGADHNNFGPRIGMAWDPFGKGKTSVRAGLGISYEGTLYNPLSNSRWNPPFYSFNLTFNALGGGPDIVIYGPQTPGEAPTFDGPPTNPGQGTGAQAVGNLSGYASTNSNTAFLTGIVFPEGIKDPWVANYYFGIQHEILPKTVLEVNYVGTRGNKLFRAEQANRAPGIRLPGFIPAEPGPDGIFGTADDIAAVPATVVNVQGRTLTGLGRQRLNPNYGRLRVWENVSSSWYDGLQVSLRKAMSRGFMINASYTWSHSLDTGSGWHSGAVTANGAAAGDGFSLDQTRPELDRGNSTFDIRHRLVTSYLWELPWYKDQKGVIGHILGGWQYNGSWAFQSGAHWTAYESRGGAARDYNRDGENNDRPDGPNGFTINATKDMYANGYFNVPGSQFDSAIGGTTPFFAVPCAGCNGNLPRNSFVGPGQFNVDQSLLKNIRVTEQVRLQFRFEMFNALNRANFLLPSSSTGANFANRVSSSNFGQSAGTLGPRQIQFALKVLF